MALGLIIQLNKRAKAKKKVINHMFCAEAQNYGLDIWQEFADTGLNLEIGDIICLKLTLVRN